jgi:hypothetical protein
MTTSPDLSVCVVMAGLLGAAMQNECACNGLKPTGNRGAARAKMIIRDRIHGSLIELRYVIINAMFGQKMQRMGLRQML